MAYFIETYARTCRKYGASLVTATQSLNDYYKSAGSVAALENSDWFVILQQKPETIADFKKNDRFELDDYTDALLRSLKFNGREYSDILIKGPETLAVGRLVLDSFSATVFSSSPAVYAAIEALVAQGFSMDEAIERVAYPENPEKWASHGDDDIAEAAECAMGTASPPPEAATRKHGRLPDLRALLHFYLPLIGFTASPLLLTWGLFTPLFLALGGLSLDGLMHQLTNLTSRYVRATP